jgi:hypothetical protein
MKRIIVVASVLILFVVGGTTQLAAQEGGPQIFSMEYGTVFGYDLAGNNVVNAQEYAFLISLAPQIQAGASFIQGTAPLNANFLQLRYGLGDFAVNMKSGTYGGNLGFGVGAEYAALQKSVQGVTNRLVVSVDYFVNNTGGFDNGTIGVGISFSMGM